MRKMLKNTQGTVFIIVLVIAMLMVIIAAYSSNMILHDTNLIHKLKHRTQAQFLAEAGVADALATLDSEGWAARSVASNFPETNLGGGTYDVTVIESDDGRVLLSSVGTYKGVSKTVTVEVEDNTPSALFYMMSAGNDLKLRAFLSVTADINGDMHANHNMRLSAMALGTIDVDPCSSTCCDGDISASGNISKQTVLGGSIEIAGSETEGADSVAFPSIDWLFYKVLAKDGGDYYSGDATFGSVGTTTDLSPSNAVIYVEDTAYFYGTVNLNGCIIADRIRVIGRLNQFETTTDDISINLVASRTNDIEIFYRLDVEKAVVYAGRDFSILSAGSYINITGSLLGVRNLKIFDFLTYVTYNHLLLYPELSGGEAGLQVISWNK